MILHFNSISKSYGSNLALDHFTASLEPGIYALLGPNGSGKSTLVKTIARSLEPLAGKVTEGKGLTIGYFAQQELDVLRPQDTPLEHLTRLEKETATGPQAREQELRNYLGSFNFTGDMVSQAVGSMSGGEKARLVLALIVWQRPNLLLLDEPTNHLDLATREALAMALNDFDGTVMLVSHDRHLLRAVCDDFWLVARGELHPFDGDLDDYQRYLLDLAQQRREAVAATRQAEGGGATAEAGVPAMAAGAAVKPLSGGALRKQQQAQRQQYLNQRRPLQKQLDQIEADMAALGAEKTALEERLCQPMPAEDIAAAGKQLKTVQQQLDEAEERWLQVSASLEELDQSAGQG